MRPDWDKITEEAFSSDEDHVFSVNYLRRRAELQGGTNMEKKRKITKRHHFNASMAATAAAIVMIPALTIGVIHFAPGRKDVESSKYGALVEEETATYAIATGEVTVEPTTEISAIDVLEEPIVQVYGVKCDYMKVEYDVNYDNVPSIFLSHDDIKFSYNDGNYHTGGITPGGAVKYSDFDHYRDLCFSISDLVESLSVEERTIDKNGSEWKVYISHRKPIEMTDEDGNKTLESQAVGGWFDRDVVIKFGDTGYAMACCVNSDIPEDMLMEFIKGLELVKLDNPREIEFADNDEPHDWFEISSTKVKTEENGAKLYYYCIPAGYSVEESSDSDYYDFKFVKNENERIEPDFAYYGIEEADRNQYIEKIFTSNEASRGGRTEEFNCGHLVSGDFLDKKAYINYRPKADANGYDRDVVVFFDNAKLAVSFSVHSSLSDSEVRSFIDGIELK